MRNLILIDRASGLAVAADGTRDEYGGEIAAATACRAILEASRAIPPDGPALRVALKAAAALVASRAPGPYERMSSTIAMVRIMAKLAIAEIGHVDVHERSASRQRRNSPSRPRVTTSSPPCAAAAVGGTGSGASGCGPWRWCLPGRRRRSGRARGTRAAAPTSQPRRAVDVRLVGGGFRGLGSFVDREARLDAAPAAIYPAEAAG